jgi:hypothetical protein
MIRGPGRNSSGTTFGDVMLEFYLGKNIGVERVYFDQADARTVVFSHIYGFEASHNTILFDKEGTNTNIAYGFQYGHASMYGNIHNNHTFNGKHPYVNGSGTLTGAAWGITRFVNVHHNTAESSWGTSFVTHYNAERLKCDHNISVDCQRGIEFRVPNCQAIGNHILRTTDIGIYLIGICTDSLVQDNIIDEAGGLGIQCSDFDAAHDFDNTTISGNKVTNAGGDGILVLATETATVKYGIRVDNNWVLNPASDGIQVTGAIVGTICNNLIKDSRDAIKAEGVLNSRICGNHIDTTTRDGIKIADEATQSSVADNNEITHNYLLSATDPIDDTSTGTANKIRDNIGFVTENGGAAASVADGGTITHGLQATPTYVTANPSVAGEMVSVTAVGATTFTVAIKQDDGTAGTSQTIYWRAVYVP